MYTHVLSWHISKSIITACSHNINIILTAVKYEKVVYYIINVYAVEVK